LPYNSLYHGSISRVNIFVDLFSGCCFPATPCFLPKFCAFKPYRIDAVFQAARHTVIR
jgi:hypothetical protein